MLLAAAALGTFWLGQSFAGLPLVSHDETGIYVYGNAPTQLQLQDRTTCQRNVVALDVLPRRIYRLRGAAIVADYGAGELDVSTGHTTTSVFAGRERLARRASKAMRRRGQRRPHALPAPVLPPAALKELKRVVVAARTPRSAEEIGSALGMRAAVVRARFHYARLLPPGTLKGVPVPRRTWAQVQHDRQISFAAEQGQAEERYGLTHKQVKAAVRRVRGLTGRC